jgi:hypothetical protein
MFTRPTADGRGTITFRVFVIEMPFSRDTPIDAGKLLAVETIRREYYLLLEVTDYFPQHYGMVNLDGSVPPELREEIMKRVEEKWESKESWIEVYASPVGYVMRVNGGVEFKRGYIPPLPGSEVKLFTDETFEKFVFYETGLKSVK